MIKPQFIYLASPYSHPQLGVRINRFQTACEVTGKFLLRGLAVFSPIAYGHQMSRHVGTHFEVWAPLNDTMIRQCDEVWVLMIDGWKESRGIAHEVKLANKLDKPVRFLYADGEFVAESI